MDLDRGDKMNKIGCIVMYSKPIDKNKTIPRGTVYYVDGTEEEVSLKEAAEKALEMALDYGYDNAIDNERYFNTTYEDFIENEEKYKNIAVPNKKSETKTTTMKPENIERKLPENIVEVEPPKVVKDDTKKEDNFVKDLIDSEIDKVEASDELTSAKIDELVDNQNPLEPNPAPVEEPDDLDLNSIEQKLNRVLDDDILENNEPTEDDLFRMINEQNEKAEENNKKR